MNPKFFSGVGWTDGETCERAWSMLGRYSRVIKSMTSGNRRNLLERGILCYYIKNLENQRRNLNLKKRRCNEFIGQNQSKVLTNDEHNRISQIIRTFANTQMGQNLNLNPSCEDRLNEQIKQQCRLVQLIKKELAKDGTQALRGHYQTMIKQCNERIVKFINERSKIDNVRSLTVKEVRDVKSWFWIETVPSLTHQDIQNWKISEKVLRAKEELNLIEVEKENINSIGSQLESFFGFYKAKRDDMSTHDDYCDDYYAINELADEVISQELDATADEVISQELDATADDSFSGFGTTVTDNKENEYKCFDSDKLSKAALNAIRSEKAPKISSVVDGFLQIYIDGDPITSKILKDLSEDAWLTDEMINPFFKLLGAAYPGSLFLSTFFFTQLASGKDVQGWIKKKSLHEKVIFPINHNNSHWSLGIFYIKHGKLVHYDSLESEDRFGEINKAVSKLNDIFSHFNLKIVSVQKGKSPRQVDVSSCGVHTCYTAHRIAQGKQPNFKPDQVSNYRKKMAANLALRQI
jgi:sentrin-specific protease 1